MNSFLSISLLAVGVISKVGFNDHFENVLDFNYEGDQPPYSKFALNREGDIYTFKLNLFKGYKEDTTDTADTNTHKCVFDPDTSVFYFENIDGLDEMMENYTNCKSNPVTTELYHYNNYECPLQTIRVVRESKEMEERFGKYGDGVNCKIGIKGEQTPNLPSNEGYFFQKKAIEFAKGKTLEKETSVLIYDFTYFVNKHENYKYKTITGKTITVTPQWICQTLVSLT
eukprot:GHVR01052249.1.p1 GENE.GHVR01052249.1~~GHVR01052249.1.p1  ORF type:complete len:227 (+),score=14.82 GHVR01052249.1:39-719(+)